MIDSVLLLDDNKATNFIHTKFLNRSGKVNEINSFQSGKEALEFLQLTTAFPKLIFVDINMPTMDAWEFMEGYRKLIRNEKEDSKIVLLTTTISPQDEERRKEYPEIDSMTHKPLNLDTFESVIQTIFLPN